MNELIERLEKLPWHEPAIADAAQALREQQAEIERLRAALEASGGLKCPNCDDIGFTPHQIAHDEWEQEQCEFCYTVAESVFNRSLEDTTNKGNSLDEP